MLLNIFFNSDNFYSLLSILTNFFTSLSDSVWTLKLGRPAALKVNFSLYFTRFLSFNISANLLRIRLLSSGKRLKNLFPSEANMPYSKIECLYAVPFRIKIYEDCISLLYGDVNISVSQSTTLYPPCAGNTGPICEQV